MGDKQKSTSDKTNFILPATGMATAIPGFILMTGPSSSETVFQADIFSARRVKVTPVVCLLGFIFMIHGVMRKPKTKEQNRMEWFEALIPRLIQGLTEYLPVSSSGYLAIGSALFGIEGEENLAFTIVMHVATVFSTLVILWKEIDWTFRGSFKFEMNSETRYVINILISMILIGIVGVLFKDEMEAIFGSGLLIVDCMLLLMAALLSFSYYAKSRQKENISMKDAFIIGLAQACAILPGLSRSGSMIVTGLLLGDNKAKLAQFFFLIVMPPILGEALLDVMKVIKGEAIAGSTSTLSLIVGFIAASVSDCLARKWTINIVKKGKLTYFATYCTMVEAIIVIVSQL